MIKIDPDGTFKETNELRIKSVKPLDAIEVLLRARMLPRQEYRQRDRSQTRDGSKAIPVAQRPRPVLYHLQKPLKEWLK